MILDEAHHAPAKSWMILLSKCAGAYRLWLTATEKRKDGLGPTIPLIAGNIVYRVGHDQLLQMGKIIAPKYISHPTEFLGQDPTKTVLIKGEKQVIVDRARVDRSIIVNQARNNFIVEQIAADYFAGKSILVLSPKFVEHVDTLDTLLQAKGIHGAVLVASGRKKASRVLRKQTIDRARTGEVRLILATSLAEEGLDIPRLDTIHLAYPMTDCEQAVGRIMRTSCSKVEATVHDYIDVQSAYLRDRAVVRYRFFKRLRDAGG